MRKQNVLKTAGISTLIAASNIMVPAYAAPPVYISNVAEDVYISVLDFASNSITLTIDSDRTEDMTVTGVALQYGPLTDYQLHRWALNTATGDNIQLVNSSPQGITGQNFTTYRRTMQISDFWLYNKPIWENPYDRIEFFVTTSDSNQPRIMGRADYSRCTQSTVFLNGLAAQCRAEKTGDGMLQYHPYNISGERMEISAEEDAILTANTLNWRAEPGDWGPEWYIEPEPEPTEPEPTEPVTHDPVEPEPTEPEPEDPIAPSEPTEPESPVEPANPIEQNNSGTATDVATLTASVEPGSETEVLASYARIVDGENGESQSARADQTESETVSDVQGNTSRNTVVERSLPEEDVEVPRLDKESRNNWLGPVLVASGLLMAGIGWWFLFFGKKKLTDRKEEKSVE